MDQWVIRIDRAHVAVGLTSIFEMHPDDGAMKIMEMAADRGVDPELAVAAYERIRGSR